MPEEIRAQYGYDPEQAKIAETKAAEARALQASRKERREGGVWLRITGIEEMSPVELVDPAGIPEDQIKELCGCYVYGQEVINKQVEIPNSGTVTIRPEGEGQVSPITVPVEQLKTHKFVRYRFYGRRNYEWRWKYSWSSHETVRPAVILSRQPRFHSVETASRTLRFYVVGPLLDIHLEVGKEVTFYPAGRCVAHVSDYGSSEVARTSFRSPSFKLACAFGEARPEKGLVFTSLLRPTTYEDIRDAESARLPVYRPRSRRFSDDP